MRCQGTEPGRRKEAGSVAGRPRDPEVEKRILDVTLLLLQEQGFSRMSIDAIADAAGVSKPTIYRRWTGKADIATAALTQLRISEPPVISGSGVEKVETDPAELPQVPASSQWNGADWDRAG